MNFLKQLFLPLVLGIIISPTEAVSTPAMDTVVRMFTNNCAENIGEALFNFHIPVSYLNRDGSAMLTKHINLLESIIAITGTTTVGMIASSLINAIAEYKACTEHNQKDILLKKITLLTSSLIIALIGTGLCLHHIIEDNPVTSADII